MENRSQAKLEKLVNQQEVRSIDLTSAPKQVFEMEDWIVELGQRKALLVPKTKKWMWYDRLHDEWTSANCSVNEGILLTVGKIAGMKKLPQPGDVSEWCIYLNKQKPFGPLRVEELIANLKVGQVSTDIKVWSPLATSWLTVTQTGNDFIFKDESGNEIALFAKKEVVPPSLPVPPPISNLNFPPPISPK